jgi:hypothetical protein
MSFDRSMGGRPLMVNRSVHPLIATTGGVGGGSYEEDGDLGSHCDGYVDGRDLACCCNCSDGVD